MANDPFDAALRAHAFRRALVRRTESSEHLRKPLPDEVPVPPPRQLDFARELEEALARELAADPATSGAGADRQVDAPASPEAPPGIGTVDEEAPQPQPAGERDDPSASPLSLAVDQSDDDERSAHELAKRYAPRPADPGDHVAKTDDVASRSPSDAEGGFVGAPGAGTRVPGSRRQASGVMPASRQPVRVKASRRAAAFAIVVIGVAGGLGTIVTLEMLMAPRVVPAAIATAATDASRAKDPWLDVKVAPSLGKLTTLALVSTVDADGKTASDKEIRLATTEPAALPPGDGLVPERSPTPIGGRLRMASDREDIVAGQPTLPHDLLPSPGAARDGVALDKPAATPVETAAIPDEPAADGGSDAAMPRVPSPRPDRGGSLPKGALAYAPAAEPLDRAAKAIVAKGKYKPVAKGPQPGPARVVAWVKWVNLRSSADNKAEAVAMLSAGSEVNIVKCSSWCEVVSGEKRGFILKSLLSAPAAGTKPAVADRVRKTAGPPFANPYLKPVTSNQ